jgi:hypothetical protein
MNDHDVVVRLQRLWGGRLHERDDKGLCWTVSGWAAYAVLAACYPFFGFRRQAKTREFILAYRCKPGKTWPHGYGKEG